MKNTNNDEIVDLITGESDVFLLKLNANNLTDISQNVNIDIKGETNKQNVFRLLQKYIDCIEVEEHSIAIKKGFEKKYVTDVVADRNKKDVSTLVVSGGSRDFEKRGRSMSATMVGR